jgi:ribosome recycling factor
MSEDFSREIEIEIKNVVEKLRIDLQGIRGSRPSVELVENIPVSCYDQILTIKQLGSITVVPPRGLQITAWDKGATGAIAKAIENARIGLSASPDGMIVRATLSPLGDERRAELLKVVKKTTEEARIQIRNRRDEIMKRLKAAPDVNEDQAFKLKEKIQKTVEAGNKQVEELLSRKMEELG